MLDIITIGSATRDAFLISKEFKILNSKKSPTGEWECVPFGSKIDLDDFVLTTGGGGTNSAATFASLGLKTAILTRIGKDSSGKDIIDDLKNRGIKTHLIQKTKDEQTGFSVLLTAPDGERSILVNRGASANFYDHDINFDKLKAKWFYITSLAGNTKLTGKIVRHAKKINARIAYNPGSGEIKKGLENLKPILRHLSVFNVNLEEAQRLTKTKNNDFYKIAKQLAFPGTIIIITNAKFGAYAYKDGKLFFVRTEDVEQISNTGAGDGFGSAFVTGLMNNYSMEDSLRLAMINAQSIIQSHGAKIGIIKKLPSKIKLSEIKVRNIK